MITKPYSQNPKPSITIGWLYPTLMSTYGDRGNIIVLQRIAEDAGVEVRVNRIEPESDIHFLEESDLLFMGGAQDLQQEIVNRDLIENKGKVLIEMIENEKPGLYICGAYQFLGKYYKDAYGKVNEGLGVFDMYTESFKNKPRLIGNIVVRPKIELGTVNFELSDVLVGFENHGGRTFLSNKAGPFATVVKGYGNNGKDETEGIHYKNSIGTYLHGPILPSNPELAIYLLQIAYEKKYKDKLPISFNDELATKAKQYMLNRLKTAY